MVCGICPLPAHHSPPVPLCLIIFSGFGFVTYRDGRACHDVLRDRPHIIDGREVDPKMAVPREEMDGGGRPMHHHGPPPTMSQAAMVGATREGRRTAPRQAPVGQVSFFVCTPFLPSNWSIEMVSLFPSRCLTFSFTPQQQSRKVFVGGLPSSATDEALRNYFSSFGQVGRRLSAEQWLPPPFPLSGDSHGFFFSCLHYLPHQVEEAVVIHDKQTRLPRGFGFITFLDENVADHVISVHYHELLGKMVRSLQHSGAFKHF